MCSDCSLTSRLAKEKSSSVVILGADSLTAYRTFSVLMSRLLFTLGRCSRARNPSEPKTFSYSWIYMMSSRGDIPNMVVSGIHTEHFTAQNESRFILNWLMQSCSEPRNKNRFFLLSLWFFTLMSVSLSVHKKPIISLRVGGANRSSLH